MEPAHLRLAIVTPHIWETPHPANDAIADLATGIHQLRVRGGHVDVVVVAPALDVKARRRTRRALRDLARGVPPQVVFDAPELDATAPGTRRGEPEHGWPLLATPPTLGPATVALGSSARLLAERGGLDLVIVVDPLDGEITRLLARRWAGLTAALFVGAPVPGVAHALTAPSRERLLDGMDEWIVAAEADDLEGRLRQAVETAPERIRSVPTLAAPLPTTEVPQGSGLHVVIGRGWEDDVHARDLVRGLRGLAAEHPALDVTLLGRWGRFHRPTAPRELRGRLHSIRADSRGEADAALRGARVFVELPGAHPRAVAEAAAHGLPIVSMSPGGAAEVVAALAEVLASTTDPTPATPAAPSHVELGRQLLAVAEDLRAKRRQPSTVPAPGPVERPCLIDLHMHTNHSHDCATEPEALLHAARSVGLTAIAVTDHNEVSGALACAALAHEYGLQVIVGEEIMTTQGEVIGLFLKERIEPGLGWHETLELIRAQGGLVYVPHPFDRLHTIPDGRTLRDTLDEIDAFEVYNSRLTFERYNRDAERFARKYNLVEGAGSDAHVVQGLGTAAVQMPAWEDPESFLTALSQGEILRRPKSLLYLQGLKRIHQVVGRAGTGKPQG